MSEQTTNHEFRAETRKVLNILTHSLYSNREIFLRELISNASDALDKLRFLQSQTQHEAIRDAELPLEIRISSDKVQNCLTITDTGIGMTRDEMIENLGTIAHSGSEAFLKEHTQTAEDGTTSDASNIIGRFGIGFYSVFMVADKVEVTSLSATGDGPAYRWISDGTGTFTVEEAPDQADIKRGTTIRAFIKESDKEFLEKYRIEGIIRTHSSFIPFPILVDGERVNTTPALWREPKFSIKKEQYDEFYKFLTYDQKDPLDVLHLSVDAPVQFNALLFIPDITKDYFGAYREHWGLDLYARRVLIQRENKELIPDYLAFLKGVVDTEDLPLNISRETLQENIVLRKISQTISKQILSHLEKMAKDDAEKYNSFWKLHGKVFKLGYSDFVNRDRITPLLRFNSSAMEDADGLTSLDDYISRARESQKKTGLLGKEEGGSGIFAALAGVMMASNYGNASFSMGFLPGIKAFTAAVLGGIGNIRGAMIGGILLGIIEALGAGYLGELTHGVFGSNYQDVFAFIVLILVLVFRPAGLLGERVANRA